MKKEKYYKFVRAKDKATGEYKLGYMEAEGYIFNRVAYTQTGPKCWIATDIDSGLYIREAPTLKECKATVESYRETIDKRKKQDARVQKAILELARFRKKQGEEVDPEVERFVKLCGMKSI